MSLRNCVWLGTLTLWLSVASLEAQVVTGAITGRVTDTTGAVVPATTIQIQNVETGFSRTLQTDGEGRYVARNLPVGSYSVTVQQSGFQTQVRRGLVLAVASDVVVNFELGIGAVQETVDVTAEAPAIETTNATLSGLVSQDQMRDLPLNGRSYERLALLSPGVLVNRANRANPATGFGVRLAVNGDRAESNLYLLDGTVVNDNSGQSTAGPSGLNLGMEAIREFRVLTHNFSAEYGRNSGAVVSAVTRSGTNEFHGSAYEFVRNNIFDARNFFNRGDLPPFRRNQFGASLGGPMIRDRIFFFANYEGLRERQGTTVIASVPDANVRQGLVPDPATGQLRPVPFNPVMKPYLDLYPLPNGRNFGDGTAQYIQDFSVATTEDYAMERMDFRLSDKDTFYWRYVFAPSGRVGPEAVPIFATEQKGTNHFVVLSETHIFSGASLNEFRFAFNRTVRGVYSVDITRIDPSLSFLPGRPFGPGHPFGNINFTTVGGGGGGGGAGGQVTGLGIRDAVPQYFLQNLFQATDTVSVVRGAHSLKLGGDLQRSQFNNESLLNRQGAFLFGGLLPLLAAQPTQFTFVDPASNPTRGWRRIFFGWFIQDDFRLRPNLTLNLGFRHEFLTTPTEVNGRSANLRQITDPQSTLGPPFESAKANFAPRVGLAWDPTGSGKTSIRLGAGVYHNQVDGIVWEANAGPDHRFNLTYQVNNPPFPNGSSVSGLSPPLQRQRSVQFHLDTPISVHYSLEVQRQLVPTVSLRLGYVGSYGYNQDYEAAQNIRVAQILPDGSKFFAANAPFVNPNFGEILYLQTGAHFNYNALQIMLQKTLSLGLRFQASYAFGKALSDADSAHNTTIHNTTPWALDIHDLARDYSLSAYNQRHTFAFNSQYQMPWDKLLNGRMAKALLGGWAINGIFSAGSGFPFNIQLGFNNSRNGDRNTPDRPNLAPGASNNPIQGVTAGCQGIPAGQKLGTPDRWFDPCAFELSSAGTFGNLGRNTVRGPTEYNVDFTLVKKTMLTERKQLEFRTEFFNLFNHANFGVPARLVFNSARLHTGNEGVITSTATPGRQIQFGLRLIF